MLNLAVRPSAHYARLPPAPLSIAVALARPRPQADVQPCFCTKESSPCAARPSVTWLSPLLLQDGEQPLRPDENLGEEGEEGDLVGVRVRVRVRVRVSVSVRLRLRVRLRISVRARVRTSQ